MPRNFEKLQNILENEIENGLNIKNFKYNNNKPVYLKIIQKYNEDLPKCYKLKNNLKSRKFIYTRIKRMCTKPSILEISNISSQKASDQMNKERKLEKDEECALKALMELCEYHQITSEELKQEYSLENIVEFLENEMVWNVSNVSNKFEELVDFESTQVSSTS